MPSPVSRLQPLVLPTLITIGMVYPVVRMTVPQFVQPGLLVPFLLLLLWLPWRLRQPRERTVSPLGAPLLLCAAALAASSFFGYGSRSTVLAMLFHWGAVAVLLFLTCDLLAHGCPPRYFAYAAIGMSSFALVIGLWQVSAWVVGWAMLWTPGEQFLPVTFRKLLVGTHPNQAVMLFYLGIPFVIGIWWQATHWWQRLVWAFWMLIAVLLIFVTGSRGGWLGTGTLVAVMLTPLLFRALHQRNWRRVGWTVALTLCYGLIFGALLLANRQSLETQRGGSLFNPTGRTLFWSHALQLFGERPLFGAGPTGYATFYIAVEPGNRVFSAGHAHSIYLTVLSEFGIVGCVALLLLAAMAARVWWRGWRATPSLDSHPTPSNQPRLLLLGCGTALVGLAVHGLVEVPVPQISGMAFYLAAAGLTFGGGWRLLPLGDSRRLTGLRQPLPLVLVTVALFACALSAFIFIQNSRADRLVTQAQQQIRRGNLPNALARYEAAIIIDPSNQEAYSGRANVLARQALNDPRLLPAAIAAQIIADQLNPADAAAPLNRAALLLAAGQTAEAEAELRTLIARDTSNWALPYLLLAQIHEAAGDPAAASDWREMLLRQPDLATSTACLASAACAALPIPDSDSATLRRLQTPIDQRDPAVLDELATLAQRWLSVDLWAARALAAAEMGNDYQAQRSLRAAVDQSQMIGKAPTRLLGLALLHDALRRDDRAALPGLVARWATLDATLVPQLATLAATDTDRRIAAAALQAAQRLDDQQLLQQVQSYQNAVQPVESR